MSDSTADTNIPVTRLPFGAELPPKVPYSTTDSVGVGDAASENLPVQVNNRQIVAVGTSSNPMRAIHLKRKNSGKTVNDVPTSDTPNADDPDIMIATKQYVDSHVAVTNGEVKYRTILTPCRVRDRNSVGIVSPSGDKKIKDVITIATGSNPKYGYYTVQSDCILGIWAGANCGTIGSEIACVWMNCAIPDANGVMSNAWVMVNQFAEFLGGLDNNRQIFINVCAGIQFRFSFGQQKFSLSAGNGKTVVAEGSYKSGNFSNVAAASGVAAGSKNDCGKVIFTEFALSTISSGGEGGEDEEGGSGDDGGDDGGGGDNNTTPLTILSVASKKSGSETAATSTYCTYSSKKFTFSIPKESASSLLIDFCSELPGGVMSLKIKTVTSYSGDTAVESFLPVAFSQQLPNNVSGFQMCLPMSSFETAADNFIMTIEGADNCHHANITLLRS